MNTEKYILTQKELHLGYIKETFRAGAVIELANGRLVIDGRKFDDTRDLEILKRQAVKFPDSPWIIPYSEESLFEVVSGIPVERNPIKPKPGENMEVVQSDEDSHEVIDISSTQVSKRKAEAKETSKDKIKSNKLEIIRGDESVEDRIAALKDKNDPSSIAERARLKAAGVKMHVVQDDSLGSGLGQKTISMNAGQVLPSREEVEARTEAIKARAEARKQEVSMNRKAAVKTEDEQIAGAIDAELTVRPVTNRSEEVDPETPAATVVIEPKTQEPDLRKENEELKARLAKLESMFEDKRQAIPME